MADVDDEIIQRILTLYADDRGKRVIILRHLSLAGSSDVSMRSMRQLIRWIRAGDDEGFREECEQIFTNHGTARGGRMSIVDRIVRLFDFVDRAIERPQNRALILGVGALTPRAGAVFLPLVLGLQIGIAVWRWRRGEINSNEAAERILTANVSMIGAMGGLVIGARVGAAVGPVGVAIGGGVGATVGVMATELLIRRFRRNVFAGNEDEALDHAYSYFALNPGSTNEEVNEAYRQRTLRTHPNIPGGSFEAQAENDAFYAMIRLARGDRAFRE